ncbi:MAG: PAS domain S-box protein [Candidatus Marinimicrobia bacterium]|nr:PAS domain S-box protein [Candidatus Neomarinimicrobiota bacterium]MCF7880527.1 PAS domain S-box protein [Candidatus Neomarinimicrobiota bacterium]
MSKPKILHIEDDPNIRELVTRVLEDEFEIAGASTGLEGIKAAQEFRPDLILMDLQLPSMSGYEATTRIHSIEELKDLPIVAVTGNNTEEEREKTLAAGCRGFIPKPIDLFALPEQISEYLSGKVEETTDEKRTEYFQQYSEELVKKLQDRIEALTEVNDEMKRLNRELQRRDQYIENMVDALWVVDRKDQTQDMNPALLDVLGYTADELISQPIYKYMDSESRKKYFTISIENLQHGIATQNELTFLTKEGDKIKALVSSQPVSSNEESDVEGYFHVLHDITQRKQLEFELRESEKKYRSLVNNSLIGIFRVTHRGRFSTVNPRLVEILGYDSEQELYGLGNILSLFKDRDDTKRLVERISRHPVINDEELTLLKKDGKEIVVLVNVQKVEDGLHGEPVYEGLVEDITEKRQLEISLRQANRELEVKNKINRIILAETELEKVLQHLIGNALQILEVDAAALYMYDKEHMTLRYGYGNGLQPDWLHHFRTIPVGESESHFLVESFMKNQAIVLKDLEPFLRDYKNNGSWRFTTKGTWIAMPIALNDKVLGIFLCAKYHSTPLSDQEFRTMEALSNQMAIGINHVNQIEDLNQSKKALEESFTELAKMNKFKDEFLANMSHELRTPLNSIIGFSEVLIDGLAGDVNEEQYEFLENILGSGQHLLSLINDILDMSKIRSGQMELMLEETDCQALIDELNQTLSGVIRGKQQEYIHEIDPEITTLSIDKKKIKQVLLNLLGNANKFTPKQGTIRLQIQPVTRDGTDYIQFAVSDTGIGIPEDERENIFDEFRQVDGSHSREYDGTGLGLPIAKKLVELHGGRIWVESEVNQGATFSFILPTDPDEIRFEPDSSEEIYAY